MLLQPVVAGKKWQSILGVFTVTEKVVHMGMLHIGDMHVECWINGPLGQETQLRDS